MGSDEHSTCDSLFQTRPGPAGTHLECDRGGDASTEELAIREVNTGIFCFDGGALIDALPRVGTDNAQGERYLPDVLPILRADGERVGAFVADDPNLVLGVNDQVHLATVRAIAQARIIEGHQRAGAVIGAQLHPHQDAMRPHSHLTETQPSSPLNEVMP